MGTEKKKLIRKRKENRNVTARSNQVNEIETLWDREIRKAVRNEEMRNEKSNEKEKLGKCGLLQKIKKTEMEK